MASWVETWTAPDGSPWDPQNWSGGSGSTGTATVEGNRGRLAAGALSYATVGRRFGLMADQRDTDKVFTFIPASGSEWYVNVGARTTPSDALGTFGQLPQGVYLTVVCLLGQGLNLSRVDENGVSTLLASTSTGLPTLAPGVAFSLRFRVQGRGLYGRLWAASGPEPSAWNLVWTDVSPDAWLERGKVTVAYTTNVWGDPSSVDFEDLTVTGLDVEESGRRQHQWAMWSRTTGYANDENLPILSVSGVLRHLGVSRAVANTSYTEARWESLGPGRGLLLYRDGEQFLSGRVTARELNWDAENGRVVITVEVEDEIALLKDVPVFPDPTRAPDDQTVHDYWTYTGVASSAMRQLIADQIGPTAHLTRRIASAAMGADPGLGLSRTWSALWDADGSVLGTLAAMSVASGANLGVRSSTSAGTVTYDIVAPRDLSDSVKFSLSFGNVAGLRYREEAPTATDVVVAGQGDLHLRLRRYASTASSLALSWGRRVWKYIDRRDTVDLAELDKANADALAEGEGTVSLTAALLDSAAAVFRRDYDRGDRVTVYVRVPGQEGPVAEVVDVIREVAFSVDDKGVEKIRPAIGSYDAKAVVPTPTQQQLARVGDSLAGLRARK